MNKQNYTLIGTFFNYCKSSKSKQKKILFSIFIWTNYYLRVLNNTEKVLWMNFKIVYHH